jgi:hypothetical protein
MDLALFIVYEQESAVMYCKFCRKKPKKKKPGVLPEWHEDLYFPTKRRCRKLTAAPFFFGQADRERGWMTAK